MLHLLEGRVPTCIICNSSVGGDLSLLPHVFLPLLILAFYGYGPVDQAFVLGGLPNPTLFCCLNGEPVPVLEPHRRASVSGGEGSSRSRLSLGWEYPSSLSSLSFQPGRKPVDALRAGQENAQTRQRRAFSIST